MYAAEFSLSKDRLGHAKVSFTDFGSYGEVRAGPALSGPRPDGVDICRLEDDGTIRIAVGNALQASKKCGGVRWFLLVALWIQASDGSPHVLTNCFSDVRRK